MSAEMIVAAAGVWRTRSVQRLTEAERWEPEAADFIGGVPWKTSRRGEERRGKRERG